MIEVTQADREAAATMFTLSGPDGDRLRSHVAFAFARHRTTAEVAKDARIKELEAKLATAREALLHTDALCPVDARACTSEALAGLLYNIEMRVRAALKEIDNG